MQWVVSASESDQRADLFVRQHTRLSRADVNEAFALGRVRINGRRAAKGVRLREGDRIAWEADLPLHAGALPDPEVPVEVTFEDDALLVVEKPAGLACHPLRAGELGCLANGLVARFPELAGVGYEPRQPGLVNRIDNDTSGLVLVARTPASFEALRSALQRGEMEKEYVAVCAEHPGQRLIELPLVPDPADSRRVRVAAQPGDTAGACRSEVVRVEPWLGVYRVGVEAHRARRHQIRAHLASVGAPLLGDELYGGRPLACGHHLLHASKLVLNHPTSGKRLHFESSAPSLWERQVRTGCRSQPDP